MSKAAEAEVKVNLRQKAIDRIGAILNKYKLIKAPSVIQEVVKHVYGDLSSDEAKADKAFGLISKLINELVDNGSINAYAFVNTSIPTGQETPSVITETLLVLPSFQLAGFVPASQADAETPQPSWTDDGDEEEERNITDDVLNEIEINEILSKHAEAFAIVPFDKKGKQKPVIVRHTAESALGKFLTIVADEEVTANMYAMVAVNLEVKTTIERNTEPVAETELDEDTEATA